MLSDMGNGILGIQTRRTPLSYTAEGRIFSSYLRPWVLHANDASAHVPLLTDIDLSISDVLVAFEAAKDKLCQRVVKNRRLRGKQSRPTTESDNLRYVYTNMDGEPLSRSYANAWKDYRCKHIVSKWAARIIQQFNASHLADSLESLEAENAGESNRDRSPIDTSWMNLTTVREILQGTASAERRRAGDDDKIKLSAHAHQVEAAKTVSENLWSLPQTADLHVDISNKHQSIVSSSFEKSVKKKVEETKQNFDSGEKKAGLTYRNFSLAKANAWLHRLTKGPDKKKPSEEQLECVREVIKRCAIEARETNENREFRSEPMRMLLHGVPG